MNRRRRLFALAAVLLLGACAPPFASAAQDTRVSTLLQVPDTSARIWLIDRDAWAADTPATQFQAPPPQRPRRIMGLAIGLGIGAGAGTAAWAADRYGDNERGSFCTRCFAQWSAVAIPIGAGVGAIVGYTIDKARGARP